MGRARDGRGRASAAASRAVVPAPVSSPPCSGFAAVSSPSRVVARAVPSVRALLVPGLTARSAEFSVAGLSPPALLPRAPRFRQRVQQAFPRPEGPLRPPGLDSVVQTGVPGAARAGAGSQKLK